MFKNIKRLLTIIILPLLTLTGCPVEEVETPSAEPTTLNRIDISPSPIQTRGISELTLAKGNKQYFIATGYYSDGSSRRLTDLSVRAWHSSDKDLGFFPEPGVLSAASAGQVIVYVIKDGVTSNTVSVDVTNAVITSIAITPSLISVAKGQTQQLQATATYSDTTSSDVSNSVTWTSNDLSTTTVTSTGLLSGSAVGSATVTATKDGVTSNTVTVDVTAAVLTSIAVTPSPVSVAKGQTKQLRAIAIYSDTTSSDVSDSVTWTSNDLSTATVTPTGLLASVEVGSTTVTASKNGVNSNAVTVDVTDAVVTSIAVTQSRVSVAKGQTEQLLATAIYSDTSSSDVSDSVTWTSNDLNTATVTSSGLLASVEVGQTTVSATKDNITSNAIDVNVTAAVITSIAVTPSPVSVAKGQTKQLRAIAIYSDTTSSDVSDSVTWTSNELNTATVTPSGLLASVEVGSTTVTASKNGIHSNTVTVDVTDAVITSIAVTPSLVSVAKGQTKQLLATATYSDTTSSDVSNSVTWTSNDLSTVTVTSDGLLSSAAVGSTTITASKNGVTSNTVTVDVTDAVITSIAVTPSTVSVAKGQTKQLLATATYSDTTSSDVSDSVTWTSNELNTATVTPTGLLTGVDVGQATISATKDNVTSNPVNVDVTAAVITSIAVTPSSISVAKGQTEQLLATATYSDTTSSDVSNSVTWTSNDLSTVTVTSVGLLSGAAVGGTTVTASKNGVTSNPVNVDVTAAVLTSITVTPSWVSVAKGQTKQLLATATYSDTTSSDVSDSVTWTSHALDTATVTPTGLLASVEVGQTTISATKDNVTSNPVNVDVTAAVITSIAVTPSSVSVTKGQTEQLLAIATYSDTTSSDVSDSVTWTSNDLNTATVTPTGLLTGINVTSTRVTAISTSSGQISGIILSNTTVTATKGGITSNAANINVYECVRTGSSCLNFVNIGSGKLFTNSPSKLFLDNLGGSANNGFTQEIGTSGPVGDFYLFNWSNADSLCATYNTRSLAGRSNWRLATRNELQGLFNTYGNMFTAHGWAVRINYWSGTRSGPGYYNVSLKRNSSGLTMPKDGTNYASCVSVP